MKKTYTHKDVVYGSNGPKWVFQAGNYELKLSLPGGAETAHKVAKVVNGAFLRTHGGMDNLGRANINTLIAKAKPQKEHFNIVY